MRRLPAGVLAVGLLAGGWAVAASADTVECTPSVAGAQACVGWYEEPGGDGFDVGAGTSSTGVYVQRFEDPPQSGTSALVFAPGSWVVAENQNEGSGWRTWRVQRSDGTHVVWRRTPSGCTVSVGVGSATPTTMPCPANPPGLPPHLP